MPAAVAVPYIMAAAAAVSAGAAVYSGVEQSKAASYNRKMAEAEAAAKETQTNEQIRRMRIQKQQILGSQRTSVLSSGVSMTGSTLTALMAEAATLETNIMDTATTGGAQQAALLNQAYLYGKQGKTALTSGILKGTSTLLSGVGSAMK